MGRPALELGAGHYFALQLDLEISGRKRERWRSDPLRCG